MFSEAKKLTESTCYHPIMERFLVKPAYYRHPASNGMCKIYLVFDLDTPRFDEKQDMQPTVILQDHGDLTVKLWMEAKGYGDKAWKLAPVRMISWSEARRYQVLGA